MSAVSHSGQVVAASDETFDVLVGDERLVLVDFTAEWCGPCKELHPQLVRFAADNRENIAVVSVDVDHVRRPGVRHDVYCMPTLLLLDGGTTLLRLSGDIDNALGLVATAATAHHTLPSLRSAPSDREPSSSRSFDFPPGRHEGLELGLVPPDGNLLEGISADLGAHIEVPEGWTTSLAIRKGGDVNVVSHLRGDAVDVLQVFNDKFGDEELATAVTLAGLTRLELTHHQVSDDALAGLPRLPNLRILEVEFWSAPSRSLDPAVIRQLQATNPQPAVNNWWVHPKLRDLV